ncbi:MAG: hypothetical protein QOE31_973 [Solirubrobacteraceae bacterium]|nr:hypothetical protein [Solirubrobacteraceae bacterium]
MRSAAPFDHEGAPPPHDDAGAPLRAVDALRLLAIGLAAILAMIAIAAEWDSPVRAVLTFALVLFLPGLAIGELLEIRDPVQRLALATGASLALATLVAVALFYAVRFSAETATGVLVGVTWIALIAALLRRMLRGPLGPTSSHGGR